MHGSGLAPAATRRVPISEAEEYLLPAKHGYKPSEGKVANAGGIAPEYTSNVPGGAFRWQDVARSLRKLQTSPSLSSRAGLSYETRPCDTPYCTPLELRYEATRLRKANQTNDDVQLLVGRGEAGVDSGFFLLSAQSGRGGG
jgi:hypothetical protein